MSFDHDDLGIDLERAKTLPTCDACRKQSDGAKTLYDHTLCGTHFDEVLALLAKAGLRTDRTRRDYVRGYVYGRRVGEFRSCWEAKEES